MAAHTHNSHAHHSKASNADPRSKVWREATRDILLFGKKYTVSYPKLTDPRLVQIAVLSTVTILGQTVFDFTITPLQIFLVVATSVLLDIVMIYRSVGILAFPTSGFISSLSLAILLEVHWGALMYIIYVVAGILAIGSKHLLQYQGRHVFNPSNFAIVIVFLLFPDLLMINPDEWTVSLWLLLPIIFLGTRLIFKARVAPVAIAFILTEAIYFSLYGYLNGMVIIERLARMYNLSLISPALLIFTFFMITDPRTVPKSIEGKIMFGSAIASLHWMFMSFGFGAVSLFLGLFCVCLVMPLIHLVQTRGIAWASRSS